MKRKLVMMAMGTCLAFAAMATNYRPTWSGSTISIDGVNYYDMLRDDVWYVDNSSPKTYKDPTLLEKGDNMIFGASANITASKNATIEAMFVAGQSSAQYNVNLNGKTLTAAGNNNNNGLRNMSSNTKFTLSNGTLKLGQLLWPDRSDSGTVLHDNEFTVTGVGTTLDVNALYFGYNMATKSGQGYGNKVIVTNGAFMAANVNLAWYTSFPGAPNGLYVTGSGTVFSNKNASSSLAIQDGKSANSFSNEFVVADGAVVKGLDNFQIGATRATIYGEGHLLAFRGANTTHTFKGIDSSLGLSHRLEVDGAAITNDNVYIHNFGTMTVKNGGSVIGKIGQYGTLLLSGEGSKIEASAFSMNQPNLPPVRIEVTDGALLSTPGSLQFGANGSTNASLFVRSGGKVSCNVASVGHASTNLAYSVAPYGCVVEVDGVGSVLSNISLSVGAAINGVADFKGCGTNGHDNVVRVMNGGKIWTDPRNSISIGFVCPSNALEVLDGGLFECGTLYIGRMGTATIGPFKAQDVVFDNKCLVSGGTIESTGLFSIRGNNSLCYVTNGVVHTTNTNILECVANTGYLQIAGTNSLLKGDLAFRVATAGTKIVFALPLEGYARAPIQSDNVVSFHAQTDVGFEPPVDAGRISDSYTLAQVPESGTLDVPATMITNMRTAIAALGEQDERFAKYRVKVVVEDGYRRLVARKPGGLILSFK